MFYHFRYYKSSVFLNFLLITFLFCFSSCFSPKNRDLPAEENLQDTTTVLDLIKERGKLVAVTNYNLVNYYIHRGEPVGYQYELLKNFTNYLGVRLELKLEDNVENCIKMLDEGEVDLIAMGLASTKNRKKFLDFSDPIIITNNVLVQRMPSGWDRLGTRDEIEKKLIRTNLELAEKTIYVTKESIFKNRLETLSEEMGDTIYIVEDSRSVDELMVAVAKGEIDYTIADEYIALVCAKAYPNLDVKTPVSFLQKISWAVRKECNREFVTEINKWLASYLKTTEARNTFDKYFKTNRAVRLAKTEYNSLEGGQLSVYDSVIREVANDIDWDWRLLASLIYQESEFKPNVVSWAGAYGLMQLMPVVMEQYGIDSTATPEQQIRIGGNFILYLDKQIPETVKDSVERIKFVLAAYNSGVGHVLDARRLAKKYEKNPDKWTGEVDFYMLNKSNSAFYNDPLCYYGYARGRETYDFVEQILDRFEHYKTLVKE